MRILLVCATVIGFLILAVIYSTAKGYTAWYWRNPHAQIFVNGHRVSGYVHQSKYGLIITRGDLRQRRSYIVSFLDNGAANLTDCSPWTAPSLLCLCYPRYRSALLGKPDRLRDSGRALGAYSNRRHTPGISNHQQQSDQSNPLGKTAVSGASRAT
jgi:hypothetical protein